MKLSSVISMCHIKSKILFKSDFRVKGITNNSKKMKENFIFAAIQGKKFDGHKFLEDFNHLENFAIISNSKDKVFRYLKKIPKNFSLIETNHPIKLCNEIASLIYPNNISEKIAVTGTNGKTSVSEFVRQLWNIYGFESASIGTLGIKSLRKQKMSDLTTLEGIDFHKTLSKLQKIGCKKIITEASSIGIDRWRLFPVKFDKLGFTNLTRDHIDYHKTFKKYRESKLDLFRYYKSSNSLAIINSDDPNSIFFLRECKLNGIKVLDYGFNAKFLKIKKMQIKSSLSIIKIVLKREEIEVALKTVCEFDILNKFCALLLVKGINIKKNDFTNLNKLKMPRGRFDKVFDKQFKIYIDYAHTPDALKNVFIGLQKIKKKNLFALIGCGGNRDSGKRNLMTKIALKYCDKVIIADDNPRFEKPEKIREEMLLGINKKNLKCIYNIGNRRKAIEFGIKNLKKDDIFVITGKGHEEYQIFNNQKKYFSDYKIVEKILS